MQDLWPVATIASHKGAHFASTRYTLLPAMAMVALQNMSMNESALAENIGSDSNRHRATTGHTGKYVFQIT